MQAAREAGVAVGLLLLELGAGEGDLLGVDDDDEVATVDVRGEGRLVLAAQQDRGLAREAAQHDVRRVDDVPGASDLARLRGVGAQSVLTFTFGLVDWMPYAACSRRAPVGRPARAHGTTVLKSTGGAGPHPNRRRTARKRPLTCGDAAAPFCAHLLCKQSVQRYCARMASSTPPDPSATSPACASTRPRCKVLAHPLRSRLLSRAADGRAGHRHRPGRRPQHQLGSDLLPPAQARVRGPGRRHRRGRGQASALAGASTDSHQFEPSDFAGDEDAETALNWLVRDYTRHFAEQFERWLDVRGHVAGGLARRRRHERHLHHRHPRAGRGAQAPRSTSSSPATAGSGRATRRPGVSPSTASSTRSTSTGRPSSRRPNGTLPGSETAHDRRAHPALRDDGPAGLPPAQRRPGGSPSAW